MSEARTLQFLLREKRPTPRIISILDALFGFGFDSIEEEISEAIGVLMVDLHTDGFEESCMAVWPEKYDGPNCGEVAVALASQLDVEVLVEQDDGRWLWAEPGTVARYVEIEDLEDGVDIRPEQ